MKAVRPFKDRLNGLLDQCFGLGINRRSGFVKHSRGLAKMALAKKSAAFRRWTKAAAFADRSVITIFQSDNEIVGADHAGGMLDLFLCCFQLP